MPCSGFTGFLVLSAGVILFGTALNSSLVSLAEREREVATLLVLGYTPATVGGLFLRESVMVSLGGLLIGLPGGYLLYRSLTGVADKELFRLPLVDPTAAWAWTLVLGLLFTLASHVFVQRSISRMNWLEKMNVRE